MTKKIARDIIACALLLLPRLSYGAVSSSVSGGTLTLDSDGASDTIAVTCNAGQTQANGADVGIACSAVTSIVVNGGAGADTIDLRGLLRSAFSSIPTTTLDGGDGDDRIYGSIFNDSIQGGAGNDNISGNLGDDDIDVGDGNDVAVGNEGNDTLHLLPSSSPKHLDGGSGEDKLVVHGSAGPDVINLWWDGIVAADGTIHYTITFNSANTRSDTVETFQFFLGDGDDSVTGYLFANTALEIHGEGGNNTLSLDGKCQPGQWTAGSYTQDGLRGATWDGFATATNVNGFTFAVAQVDVAADATEATVQLNTGDACSWTVTSDSEWLVVSNASGTGSATLTLTLQANSAADIRTGHITVNGSTLPIVQAGVVINPPDDGGNNGGNTGGNTGGNNGGNTGGNTNPPGNTTSTGDGSSTADSSDNGEEPAPSSNRRRGCSALSGSSALFAAMMVLALAGLRRSRRFF